MSFQIDQPSFILPREFYVDQVTYAPYIEAYKTYIVNVARVMAREAGNTVDDATLTQKAEDIFTFEAKLAEVRHLSRLSRKEHKRKTHWPITINNTVKNPGVGSTLFYKKDISLIN